MTSAIGIRVYQITANYRGNPNPIPFSDSSLKMSPADFVTQFVSQHATVVQNDEKERSWFFDEKKAGPAGNTRGYVHYGTFGFESNFIDSKTKAKNYRRQVSDIEEIPLFYEFWSPPKSKSVFAAFQSFQGRSCIGLVMKKMREQYEAMHSGIFLSFKKLMPNDVKGSAYYSAPVKRLRLISRKVSSDVADRYFDNPNPDPIDFELVVSARRRRSLGSLSALMGSMKGGSSVVTHEGIDFPEAIAEIKVGNKLRRVGVLGTSGDAGVIDLTDAITKGPDGHPTFQSMTKETEQILADFYGALDGLT